MYIHVHLEIGELSQKPSFDSILKGKHVGAEPQLKIDGGCQRCGLLE